MFKARTIEDVVSKLDLALPSSGSSIARSSVSQARERVGSEPIRWLFERTACVWSERSVDDRGFFGARFFLAIEETGNRQWMSLFA